MAEFQWTPVGRMIRRPTIGSGLANSEGFFAVRISIRIIVLTPTSSLDDPERPFVNQTEHDLEGRVFTQLPLRDLDAGVLRGRLDDG